jgi:glycyl-tRNA synthetase (class II)
LRAQVHRREDVVGLDSSIIASPKIWQSSGHVDGFSDPMVDCKVPPAARAPRWEAPLSAERAPRRR